MIGFCARALCQGLSAVGSDDAGNGDRPRAVPVATDKRVLFGPVACALAHAIANPGFGLRWNYPSSSSGTETAAYLPFALSAGALVNETHPRLVAAVPLATVLAVFLVHGGRLRVFHGLPALLRTPAEFILGVLLRRAQPGDTTRPRNWPARLAVGAFARVIHCGVNASSALGRLLSIRPARSLGAWPYSIHLLSAPTHYAARATFAAIGDPTDHLGAASARVLILVTALAVVGLSALALRYVEVPVRQWTLRTLLPLKLSETSCFSR